MPTDDSDAEDAYTDMPNTTSSSSTRFAYTNDLLAGLLVCFAIGITSLLVYRGSPIPIWLATVDAVAIGTAVVWAFGKGAAKVASNIVGGGNE